MQARWLESPRIPAPTGRPNSDKDSTDGEKDPHLERPDPGVGAPKREQDGEDKTCSNERDPKGDEDFPRKRAQRAAQ